MINKSKVIIIIAFTIIAIVGLATSIFIHLQNEKMVDDKIENTIFLGDIIAGTIDKDMKEGNTKNLQKVIESLGKNEEILNLRILSPEGTILKSADTAELGKKSQDLVQSSVNGPSQKPFIINKTAITYFKNIPNKKECYGCHSSKEMINGIIQINLDISRSVHALLSLKKFFILLVILILLFVCAGMSILFSRFVIKPLKRLLSTMNDVESGNLNATVKIFSNKDLEIMEILGASFNNMIEKIIALHKKDINKERELSRIRLELEHKIKHEELNTQLEFKIKELETANRAITSLSKEVKSKNINLEKAVEQLKKINEIGRIMSSIIDSEELLKIITRTTADLLNSEKAILHINKNKPTTLQYLKGGGIESLDIFPVHLNSSLTDLLAYGKPLFLPQAVNGEHVVSKIGVPFQLKTQIIGAIIVEGRVDGPYFSKEDLSLLITLSNHAVVAIENAWLYKSVRNNYFSTIQSLVNALEASDKFTKGHSERVRFLSLELGKHIGLDFKELEILEQASILHDIGKIGIESFILQKQGKLTPNEYSMIKAHPLIGEEILGPIDTLIEVRQTIIQHHEHYDGKGYPYGLRGDELSLKSKILSVTDTFDAMMSDRPYRKAISIEKIRQELLNHAGTQFDPYIAKSFIELLDSGGEDILSSAGYYTYQITPEG